MDLLDTDDVERCKLDEEDEFRFDRFGQTKQKKKITSIHVWNEVFDVFKSIWLQNPKNQPFEPNITTYGIFVRQMYMTVSILSSMTNYIGSAGRHKV